MPKMWGEIGQHLNYFSIENVGSQNRSGKIRSFLCALSYQLNNMQHKINGKFDIFLGRFRDPAFHTDCIILNIIFQAK